MAMLTTSWKQISSHTVKTGTYLRLQARYVAPQNVLENSTAVQMRLVVEVTGSGNYWSTDVFTTYLNGTSSAKGYQYFGVGTEVVQTKNITVKHDSGGAYSGQMSYRLTVSYGNSLSTKYVDYEVPTIPRGAIINSSTISTIESEFSCDITSHTGVDRLELVIGNTVVKTVNGYVTNQLVKLADSEVLVAYNLMASMSAEVELRIRTFGDDSFTTQIGETSVLPKEISIGGQLNIGTPSGNKRCLVWVGSSSGNKKCNAFIGTSSGNRRGV